MGIYTLAVFDQIRHNMLDCHLLVVSHFYGVKVLEISGCCKCTRCSSLCTVCTVVHVIIWFQILILCPSAPFKPNVPMAIENVPELIQSVPAGPAASVCLWLQAH